MTHPVVTIISVSIVHWRYTLALLIVITVTRIHHRWQRAVQMWTANVEVVETLAHLLHRLFKHGFYAANASNLVLSGMLAFFRTLPQWSFKRVPVFIENLFRNNASATVVHCNGRLSLDRCISRFVKVRL